jgi:dienelactone hydrolase
MHAPTIECTVEPVNSADVVGLFARPATHRPHSAIIAFGGSSGGFGPSAMWAPALAQHGYAVLAIAYFGAPGLPAELDRIDVDVVTRAARWLRNQPDIANSAFAVMGVSRGSELALLAGIHVAEIGPIIALAPSGVSWFALGARGPMNSPSWIVDGEAVPYPWPEAGFTPPRIDGPLSLRPMFEELLRDRAAIERAEISVEHCQGPILVSGDDDQMWPSTTFAENILQRLAAMGGDITCDHLHYPNAGHVFANPPGTVTPLNVAAHPLTGASYAFGGTPAGNAAAQGDSWPRIINFLNTHLPTPN